MIDVERLTRAIVEVEESKIRPECLDDTCDHEDDDPIHSPGVGCGDAAAIAKAYEETA